MAQFEVTQAQYLSVRGTNPSQFAGDVTRPVEQVSWYEAVAFCNALSDLEGLQPCYTISGTTVSCDFSKSGYRLPTEAEWEYAARGGRLSRGYTYAGSNTVDDVAWYSGNSGNTTHPVGTGAPNELGLHDMSGNVWEWCWDWYRQYQSGTQSDPTGPSSGTERTARGGSWFYRSIYEQPAHRGNVLPGDRYNGIGFRVVRRAAATVALVLVEGGTFQMGYLSGKGERPPVYVWAADWEPVHSVAVSSFLISKYEVTQEQYQAVMGSNPSSLTPTSLKYYGVAIAAPNRPVEGATWYDAVAFCNALSALDRLSACYTINGTTVTANWSANGYRLPTEAEWEYAARGGAASVGYSFSGSDDVNDVGWDESNPGGTTRPVGTKAANELGIYDMTGNVWEWCWDWYGSYSSGAQTDPAGPRSGTYRVIRGGSCSRTAGGYRHVAYRSYSFASSSDYSYIGFRPVRRPG
jgi:formylglycine-generating enzyme required for sulfatase activity